MMAPTYYPPERGKRGKRRNKSATVPVVPTRPCPSGAGGRIPSNVFALLRAPLWGLKSGVPGICCGVGPIRRPMVLIPRFGVAPAKGGGPPMAPTGGGMGLVG